MDLPKLSLSPGIGRLWSTPVGDTAQKETTQKFEFGRQEGLSRKYQLKTGKKNSHQYLLQLWYPAVDGGEAA